MTDITEHPLPERIAAIKAAGIVNWSSEDGLPDTFKQHFTTTNIPVAGIRHVRQWGIQVDDEREFPGHERTTVKDEELWEIVLVAKDGSHYEVNSKFIEAAA